MKHILIKVPTPDSDYHDDEELPVAVPENIVAIIAQYQEANRRQRRQIMKLDAALQAAHINNHPPSEVS